MKKDKVQIRLTKERIRNKILLKLKTQKEAERSKKSGLIKTKLFCSQVFRKAKIVMFYKAIKGEVDTEDMIKRAQRLGKIVVVPVCVKNKTMIPCILEKHGKLSKGPYDILEPVEKKPVDLEDLDLVVVPGLAFTKTGKRLGRGKGYYDCFLKKLPKETVSIGIAFDFQILPKVPTDAHDINTHKVIFA